MPTLLEPAVGELRYQLARRNMQHEERDIHEADEALAAAIPTDDFSDEFKVMAMRAEAEHVPFGGKVLKDIDGMGKVYDWRSSSWTPTNGGPIRPAAFVHHIPVIPNVKGIGDFVTLRNVLVAQGLMVQTATDHEGNVALYTPFDYLCYHARGGNQVTTGCEHMHFLTSEPWSKKQLRASAWLIQLAERKHGIHYGTARIGAGQGAVRVLKKGQTTHREISAKAGYFDRSDPGEKYDEQYVRHCVRFFKDHGHFRGA